MSLISDRYKEKEKIGEGGMQSVFLAEDIVLDREVVLKIPKNESAMKRFQSSAVLSARVSHPNIARTLDYFESDGEGRLIEEYVPGLDLNKWTARYADVLDPHLVAHVLHHLAKGLAAVHHVGVIHRDLKPGNILVSDDLRISTTKITDFGISKMAEAELEVDIDSEDSLTASSTVVGALPYMSPELLTKEESDVSQSTDIWSIGAIAYRLVAGKPPFGNGPASVYGILKGAPPSPPDYLLTKTNYQPLGEELWKTILHCMAFDANDRPSADELSGICSELCYLDVDRAAGRVYNYKIRRGAWGFISPDTGGSVFLHAKNLFGEAPSNGMRVAFSQFDGNPQTRAFPVFEIKDDDE